MHELDDMAVEYEDGSCKDVDEALVKAGGCGMFQIILVAMMMVLQTATAYQTVSPYFIGYNPPWRCSDDNTTEFCHLHRGMTFDVKDGSEYQQRCLMNRSDWNYTIPKTSTLVTEVIEQCN